MTITSKSASLNHLRSLIIDRNQRETLPFVSIHQANAQLLNQLDALQSKYDAADREISSLRHQIQQVPISKASAAAASASLKNEARLRDKLEQLQDEYNARLKTVTLEKEASIKMSKDLAAQKDVTAAYEKTIQALQLDATKLETAIAHLQQQVKDGQEVTKLAEQQYDGLKLTIRHLQTENEELQKENRSLQERLLADKGQLVEEMNGLNELVEALKMEVEMLRSYKTQEDQRKNYWFGGIMSAEGADAKDDDVTADSRKFGSSGVIVPCAMKQTIPAAHSSEGMCLRYDPSGSGLFATSSSDATVKVWDSGTGSLRATLRGAAGAAIIGCDMSGSLAVGGGSDKTCRVWNIRTQRMIHHLVGHQHKITCVRLFGGDKFVLTGSADRSLRVWDISQKTYRQVVTLRHSSTVNCADVGSDSMTGVSGHLDGGLRLWDLRSGERTGDLPGVHDGAITSVQFNPANSMEVLTNSMDSSLKIVDIRTGTIVQTMRHADFHTSHGYSNSSYSPDGKFVTAGSNTNGDVFVWAASDGGLRAKLPGHSTGVCGIGWGRGNQQVASVDRQGTIILWA